jgi:hypothetical protein
VLSRLRMTGGRPRNSSAMKHANEAADRIKR